MNTVFVFLIILVLAFTGYHLSFRRVPLFGIPLYLTGTEFLFFGLLLGPMGLRILTKSALEDLGPFTALLPAVAGLITGLQLHTGRLLRMPRRALAAGFLEGLVCAACLLAVFEGAARLIPPAASWPLNSVFSNGGNGFPAALIVSAALCVTVPTGLLLMAPAEVSRSRIGLLLQHIAVTNALAGLVLYSIPWFLCAPDGFGAGLLALAAVTSCLSLLLVAFLSLRRSPGELQLFAIAASVMTGGLARMICFSPLMTGFMIGVVLVSFSREGDRLLNLLLPLEKPVYLLLLLFLGALWPAGHPQIWIAGIILCAWRIGAKQISGRIAARVAGIDGGSVLGAGLLGTGGLALAMIFDASAAPQMQGLSFLAAAAPAAILLSDFVSPLGLRCLPRMAASKQTRPASAGSSIPRNREKRR